MLLYKKGFIKRLPSIHIKFKLFSLKISLTLKWHVLYPTYIVCVYEKCNITMYLNPPLNLVYNPVHYCFIVAYLHAISSVTPATTGEEILLLTARHSRRRCRWARDTCTRGTWNSTFNTEIFGKLKCNLKSCFIFLLLKFS